MSSKLVNVNYVRRRFIDLLSQICDRRYSLVRFEYEYGITLRIETYSSV